MPDDEEISEKIEFGMMNLGDKPEAVFQKKQEKDNDSDKFQSVPLNDPSKWVDLKSESVDYLIRNLKNQDPETLDFSLSKRQYKEQNRFATKSLFFSQFKNGEKKKREWLFYSESDGKIYCIPCKLFCEKENVFVSGFNDWKNSCRLTEHEKIRDHRNSTEKFVTRSNIVGKIDSELHRQYIANCNYWREVLHRVLRVIKFLGTRALAFRGSEDHERFGSDQNGNFLGLIELIAEYDPFLARHVKKHGNPGSGRVNYLSKTTCEEFIEILYQNMVHIIVEDLKKNKYFSITVDSTPDISHADQLTFVVRYVDESGAPVERFLKFIRLQGHTAEEMESIVLETLAVFNINLEDMRGQSYDNASNISGIYTGLQTRLRKHNELALYVPCAPHSLNLVGVAAAESCLGAIKYFMFVQKLYVFFTASTSRWSRIESQLKNRAEGLLPKSLSGTRWAARYQASEALVSSYQEFEEVLLTISRVAAEKADCRSEAEGLYRQLKKSETGIMSTFWKDILKRFDKTSKSLQDQTADLSDVVHLYNSLINYIETLRDQFDYYEMEGMKISGCEVYENDGKRKKKRKRFFDETNDDEYEFDNAKSDFRINTFLVIIDKLIAELKKRAAAYSQFDDLFGFLSKLNHLDDETIRKKATVLQNFYQQDLDEDFPEECVQFREFMLSVVKNEKAENQKLTPKILLQTIREKNLTVTFPNLDVILRIFLSILASNAGGERSFSVLKRVKNYLRNTCSDSRLSSLAAFSSNPDIFSRMDFDSLISEFAAQKARKKIN